MPPCADPAALCLAIELPSDTELITELGMALTKAALSHAEQLIARGAQLPQRVVAQRVQVAHLHLRHEVVPHPCREVAHLGDASGGRASGRGGA